MITGAAGMAFALLVSTSSAYACNTSSGEVTKIDADKHTVVISASSDGCSSGCDKTESTTFTLKKETKVLINGKQASLADLKAGDKVKIDFEKSDDVLAVNATRAS